MLDTGGGGVKKSVFARTSLMDDPLPIYFFSRLSHVIEPSCSEKGHQPKNTVTLCRRPTLHM